jgi:hypothetical protein
MPLFLPSSTGTNDTPFVDILQTQRCLATTTIQCWKWRIWLDCWFAQQAPQCQKCLRLQLLCCGASAYAVSVRGHCQPPPTLTNKTSDPKILHHPFQDCGLPRNKKLSSSSHRVKGISPVLPIWEGTVVYAPHLLGCTNYGSFKSTWSWEAYFYFYMLH